MQAAQDGRDCRQHSHPPRDGGKFSGELQTAVKDNASWTVAEIKSRQDSNRKLMEDYHKIQIGALAETEANTIANTQAIVGFRKDRAETDAKIMDRLFEVDRAFEGLDW